MAMDNKLVAFFLI